MTEKQLQDAVLDTARLFGWKVAHFRPARVTRNGREIYETPVAADGKGWPDLTMVRRGHLIFAELKAAKGRVAPAQQQWLDELTAVSVGVNRVQVYLWTPAEWLSGSVERVLRWTGVNEERSVSASLTRQRIVEPVKSTSLEQHERDLVCTRCGAHILVCCHVRDINPAAYVGRACGCRKPKEAR